MNVCPNSISSSCFNVYIFHCSFSHGQTQFQNQNIINKTKTRKSSPITGAGVVGGGIGSEIAVSNLTQS